MLWRLLREALFIAIIALVPALVSARFQLQSTPREPLEPGEVRVDTARQWGDKILWVDARPAERFSAGHIPGAIRLDAATWDDQVGQFLDAWDPDRTVIVYCDGGHCDDSRAVADRLRTELQIPGVYVLKGGWPAWNGK